jgi:hypothetical protein
VTAPPSDTSDADTGDEADPAEGPGVGHREHGSEEEIDEASDESFPASDAPQWWSGGDDGDDS